MDSQLIDWLEECFFCKIDGKKACEIIEENLNGVDFDDEDDVEEMFAILERALTCTGSDYNPYKENGKPYAEEGVEFLSFIISKGFDVNFMLPRKQTLLLRLAGKEILPEIFQKVVDLGANVYAENSYDENVLTISASQIFYDWGKVDLEKSERLPLYIIEKFGLSEFDRADCRGVTPLMYAVLTNKHNLVDSLLKSGAGVDETGGQGQYISVKMYGVSPFALACREGNFELAKKLLDAGADETLCDAEGTPAFFSLLFSPADKTLDEKELFKRRKADILSLLKNLDFVDSDGNTFLIKACTRDEYSRSGKNTYPDKNEDIITKLLERGVNVNAKNNDGMCALHMLAEHSVLDIVKILLEAGADIDAQDGDGETALMKACLEYGENLARYLIRKGADFNLKNRNGESVMDIAIEKGFKDIVELCLAVMDGTQKVVKPEVKPVKPLNADTGEKESKIEKAAPDATEKTEESTKTVAKKTVIKKTVAAPPAHDSLLESLSVAPPFALACRSGNYEFAAKLISSGVNEAECGADGIPALFYLLFEPLGLENESASFQSKVYQGKERIVSLLKKTEAKDAEGDTLLLKAFQKRSYSNGREICPKRNGNVIAGLIMQGADVNAVNNEGRRAIHYAAENVPSLFGLLLALGADVNARDGEGNTALILACKNGFTYDAQVLLSSGADFSIKNNAGESAKDIAKKMKLTELLELMV